MASFIIYMIRWAVVLTLLYSLYGLLMKRETLHGVNRLVLLVVLVASMALPLCQIETHQTNIVTQGREMLERSLTPGPSREGEGSAYLQARGEGLKATTPLNMAGEAGSGATVSGVLVATYLLGLAIAWLRYLVPLFSLFRIISRGKRIEVAGLPKQVSVLTHPDVKTPCSWMRWIILPTADAEAAAPLSLAGGGGAGAIVLHELAHVRLGHSWDMLLCEFTCRMLWCVPFAWMLRQDLRDLHEYQADAKVLSTGIRDEEYQLLLIRKATGTGLQPVVNALNQSPIKRRFKMMYTKPSRRWVALKATYLVPLGALALVAFARPQTLGEIEQKIETTEAEMAQSIRQSGVMEHVAAVAEGLGLKEREPQQEMRAAAQAVEPETTADSVVASDGDYPSMDKVWNLADANLVKADIAELEPAEEPFTAIGYQRATELLDSTMTAVGARKIADGTWTGHFQPSLNDDTVRISKVEYLDRQSRLTIKVRFSHNEADPYAYNMVLQQETRKDRTGYYIRRLYPAQATTRQYDQPENDPKALSTDDVLVKGLDLFDFRPVAMERSAKETRLYYFLPISTDGDAEFVEGLFDESFDNWAIRDVATNDDYMFRSQDKSYFKLAKTEKRDGKDWSVYQVCLVFPPLDKSVKEFQVRPVYADHDHFTIHRIKDIPQKARIITH